MSDTYIKIKVEGLAGGDQWVIKPKVGNGGLIKDSKNATLFSEADAFEVRKNIIAQLPKTVNVTFDLDK